MQNSPVAIGGMQRRMDPVLRARLNLPDGAALRLGLLRKTLASIDGASRLVFGEPFFALRESEALLEQLSSTPYDQVAAAVLRAKGGTRIVARGLENVPARGPVIIASTHPTGMFDYVAHAGALAALRPDLKVVANREVEVFLGPDAIVPVKIDRANRALSAKATLRAMHAHLKQGGALLVFGSGRVPRCRNGRLLEPDWPDGTTRTSLACEAPVVPAALDACNSRYYYLMRCAATRLSGGNDNIGAMIGSLRYAAELLEKLGGSYDLHYGTALPPGTAPATLKAAAEGLVPGLYA